jgi:NAD(P)-dependent dehydrogenase (short-subunit alcohol dehydrogenase family)
MAVDGKVAIITGAARGMGEATALAFGAAGARVVVSDVDTEGGEATAAAIRHAGGQAVFRRADVSRSADVTAHVETAVTEYGRLDCAVNNAAVSPDSHPLSELDEAEFDRVIAVNLKGVALCLHHELWCPCSACSAASAGPTRWRRRACGSAPTTPPT